MKRQRREKHTPKYQMGLALSLTAVVLLTGCYTLLCLWIQPNSFRYVVSIFRQQPLLIILNCVPVGALMLAFTFLFRNVFASACLVGTGCAVLSMANRIKLVVRDEPVFPRDFALLKEVFSATKDYSIQWPWGVIAVIILTAAATLALSRFIGCKPFPVEKLRTVWARLLGFIAPIAILAGLILTVYASDDLYNSFSVSNREYIPVMFNELGFPYCFCHHFTKYGVDKPEGYSRAEAERWETGDVAGLGKDVNVIMVMNEAFSDITDFDAFTYSEENDPLKNLHDIQADPNCLSGHVVVPGFAGGTAATEFDVLTGIQGATLSPGTISPFRAVNRNLDSLFRVFDNDGYQTSFLHPGYAWFYNRENVYRWFGAQEILFADQMENVEYKGTGTWVSDEYLTGLIQEKFEAAMENGTPYFNYTTTIQNHMSYTADKYGAGYEFPPVETSAELSEEAETLLKVYIEGVRDADQMLGDLRDYFAQCEEPVILVYFGDHLPYLGDGRLAYNELGMDMQPDGGDISRFIATYETPYVIWANDAAAEQLDWENAVSALDLPEDGSISACYLGATVLELTGRGASSPWFSYLSEARRELPILHKTVCQLGDGTLCKQTELSEDQQALIAKMRRWSYYKMKYKDVG